MAAPTVVWRQVTGSAASPAYASLASLDFGTVTAGAWSHVKVVTPKVTVNSIQSCIWWMNDVGATRSAVSEGVGSASGWTHKYSVNASAPVVCSDTVASAGFGATFPETTGSGVSYAAIAPDNYGSFVAIAIKVASAAGDGLTTAFGYQLKYSYT